MKLSLLELLVAYSLSRVAWDVAHALRRRRVLTAAPPATDGSRVEEFASAPRLGPFEGVNDLFSRTRTYVKVLLEHSRMLAVYEQHRKDGWFRYGAPPASFAELAEHPALRALLELRSSSSSARGELRSTLRFEADGAVLPTYLPIEEGAAAALGALSLAAAELYELRTGRAQRVVVSQSGAGLTTAQYLFLYAQPRGRWQGLHGFDATMAAEGVVKPHRKAYRCGDGGWVFLHGGFPRLKKGITDFLGCECTVDGIGAAVAKWDSLELESAMQAAGLAATKCRTPAEWRESEQGKAVQALPPVCVEARPSNAARFDVDSLKAPAARALPAVASRPLSDVVVVDFSHVIASPVVGRSLVDHGATVIKVVSAQRPRREMFDCETNHGKNVLTLELSTDEGRARLWELLRTADVLIDGFANGALARHGLPIDEVLQRNPHLVYLDLSCFGHVGPLAHGKGFQQNANFACGVAGIDDEELLAYQLVSQVDYATGFLGAYGVILGLIERQLAAEQGRAIGGVLVRTSLCQAATWMASLGARPPSRREWFTRVTRLLWASDRRSTTVGDPAWLKWPPRQRPSGPPRALLTASEGPPLFHEEV